MPGTGGGEAGDLLLKVTVAPKPGYERKGMFGSLPNREQLDDFCEILAEHRALPEGFIQ